MALNSTLLDYINRVAPKADMQTLSSTSGITPRATGGSTYQPPADYTGLPLRSTPGSGLVVSPNQPTQPAQTTPTAGGAQIPAQQFVQQWQSTHSPSEGIMPLYNAMKAAGYNVEIPTHAGGTQQSLDKLVIDGAVWDMIPNVGPDGKGTSWSMNQDGYWVNGRPASDPYGAPPLQDPQGGAAGGMTPGMPQGSLLTPWDKQFTGTDPNKIADTPAFKFRMEQGLEALQRSAASKGTLLTGGTLKDLQSFAQGLASTEFDKQWNRDLATDSFNRESLWGNQTNAFNKLAGFTQIGQQGAQTLGGFNSQYQNGTNNNAGSAGDILTGQADANAAGTLGKNDATNSATSTIANSAASIDWSKLFGKRAGGIISNTTGATSAPADRRF